MALKTTPGLYNSNSYITVEEADAYLLEYPGVGTTWTALTTAEKEHRLILAAYAMNILPWRSYRVYEYQALAFPRQYQMYYASRSDFTYDTRHIPDEIKKCQAYVAIDVIHRGYITKPEVADGVSMNSITRLELGTAMKVDLRAPTIETGGILEKLIKGLHFPIYMMVSQHLSNIRVRGGATVTFAEQPTTTSTTSTTSTSSSTSSSSTTTSSSSSTTTTTTSP